MIVFVILYLHYYQPNRTPPSREMSYAAPESYANRNNNNI